MHVHRRRVDKGMVHDLFSLLKEGNMKGGSESDQILSSDIVVFPHSSDGWYHILERGAIIVMYGPPFSGFDGVDWTSVYLFVAWRTCDHFSHGSHGLLCWHFLAFLSWKVIWGWRGFKIWLNPKLHSNCLRFKVPKK